MRRYSFLIDDKFESDTRLTRSKRLLDPGSRCARPGNEVYVCRPNERRCGSFGNGCGSRARAGTQDYRGSEQVAPGSRVSLRSPGKRSFTCAGRARAAAECLETLWLAS